MTTPAIRLATTADSAEIVRLAAALMYRSMGVDADSDEWRQAAHDAFENRLGDDLAVAVADHPDRPGQLLASGAGCITTRMPGLWA